jgi:transcriptional regulator with XRE-family HTH domain
MVMRAKTAQKQEASRLDRVQVALELTNDALAGKIGITAHAWSQYRTGARPISRDALRMLRKDYGITADYILFDDPSKLPQDIYAKIRILGAA